MRRIRTAALGLLLAASALLAANSRDCLELSATVQSVEGNAHHVRVSGYNRCDENLIESFPRFRVDAIDDKGNVIASQSGQFGAGVAPHERVETAVTVFCDPGLVRRMKAEAL